MDNSKIKTKISVIALVLMLTMSTLLIALPITQAHDPAWEIPLYAYINAAPDPVGVNQKLNIIMWLDQVMPGAQFGNDIRFHGYTLTITKPDSHTDVQTWDVNIDTTSSQYYAYYPDQIGTYTAKFEFPGQTYTWDVPQNEGYLGDYYLPASAETTFTVQEEPVIAITGYGLPQEYWTRPIYGENTDWWKVSSNWLGEGGPFIKASFAGYQVYAPDAVGSLTSHIMWTKRVQSGGVVGGDVFPIPGDTFFDGTAYLPRYENPIIMDGMIFYKEPYAFASSGFRGTDDGAIICCDLRTGEELWRDLDMPDPGFGLIFNVQNRNQHGVHQPLLVCPVGSDWMFYDAFTGYWLFNATDVPRGTDAMGKYGEFIRYVFINQGTTENPEYVVGQWNSSKLWWGQTSVQTDIAGEVRNASIMSGEDSRYDWFAPMPWLDTAVSLPDWSAMGVGTLTPIVAYTGDLMLCYNGTFPAARTQFGPASWSDYTYFAINLNESRGEVGEVMWWNTLHAPPGNITVNIGGVDQENHIWLENYKETMQWVAYDMLTGNKVWGPSFSQTDVEPFDYYGTAGMEDRISLIANDKIYSMQFSGVLFCLDELTGELLWSYGNSNEDGNSTRAGYHNGYGVYPTLIMAMGRDMIYAAATEHTVNTPIYKGARVICINATDGTEVWDMSSFVNSFHSISLAIADGYTTWWNGYSNEIFTSGRGPSETTVTASPKISIWGSEVLVEGTVMDVSVGVTQDEQIARFPKGVPAVSDASMTDWMEYVYCQRPRPTNTVGVEVILETLDPNYNYYEIGRVTTDSAGKFKLKFEPLVPGEYTIIARFEGTDGYWSSFDETAIGVSEAAPGTPIEPEPPTEQPTEQPTEPEPEAPFITTEIAIILAVAVIAVVAVVAYWVLRRRQ